MYFETSNPAGPSGAEFQQRATAGSSHPPANTPGYSVCPGEHCGKLTSSAHPAPFDATLRFCSVTLQPGKRRVQAGGMKNRRLQLEPEALQVSSEFMAQAG